MSLKRLTDVVASASLLVLLCPVILVVAALVRLKMGGPVLFEQQRAGVGGKAFALRKFRTMEEGSGSDAARLTPLGRKLRATSLDELPELLHILKGDMSLVGPRPLPVRYLSRYSERQARRHEVRPGLTGLAQVGGRNLLSWPERLELDVQYVDNQSFVLDLQILAKTVTTVFTGVGVASEESSTMTEFTGQRSESQAEAP